MKNDRKEQSEPRESCRFRNDSVDGGIDRNGGERISDILEISFSPVSLLLPQRTTFRRRRRKRDDARRGGLLRGSTEENGHDDDGLSTPGWSRGGSPGFNLKLDERVGISMYKMRMLNFSHPWRWWWPSPPPFRLRVPKHP